VAVWELPVVCHRAHKRHWVVLLLPVVLNWSAAPPWLCCSCRLCCCATH